MGRGISAVMKMIFVIICFSFIGFNSWSADKFCETHAYTEEATLSTLDQVLKRFVKTTQRAVSFYHYGSRSNQGKIALDEIIDLPSTDGTYSGPVSIHPMDVNGKDIGREYLMSMARSALHSSDQTWELGRGLYTATEPLASIGYSGDPGFLLKVTVPSKSNYLDIRIAHRDIKLTDVQASALSCFLSSGTTSHLITVFDLTYWIKNANSQHLIQRFFDRHALVFTAAGYGLYDFKECSFNPKLDYMTMAVFQNAHMLHGVTTEVIVPNTLAAREPTNNVAYKSVFSYLEQFTCDGLKLPDGYSNNLCAQDGNSTYKAFNLYSSTILQGLGIIPEQNLRKRAIATEKLFGCNPSFADEFSSPEK